MPNTKVPVPEYGVGGGMERRGKSHGFAKRSFKWPQAAKQTSIQMKHSSFRAQHLPSARFVNQDAVYSSSKYLLRSSNIQTLGKQQ